MSARRYFALEGREALPAERPLRTLFPSHLWEYGLSRIGVFPEMTAFGLRLLARWRPLQRRHRFDGVLDNQSLSWGLLGSQASGVPVAAMLHHPLHIDRQADFAIDPRFRRKWKRTLYFPLLMQQVVTPRLARTLSVSHASAAEIARYFGIPAKRVHRAGSQNTQTDACAKHAQARETNRQELCCFSFHLLPP